MSRDEIQKLMGGYATGTLTPDEQQALFTAALEDQDLFDALAREQSLRDLLRDPATKAQLLSALEPKPGPWWAAWWRPAAVAAAMAGIATLGIILFQHRPPEPEMVAVAKLPEAVPAAPMVREEESGKKAPAVRPRIAQPAATSVSNAAPPEARKEALAEPPALAKETAGGTAGGAPVPAAAPPPPAPAPERKAEAAAVTLADERRNLSGARALFFGQAAAVDQIKSGFMDAAEQKQQAGQSKQQASAPRAQQAVQSLAVKSFVPQPPQAGMRYSIAKSADRIELILESNSNGFSGVWARSGTEVRSLGAVPMEGMEARTFRIQPGENEVFVWFSRTAPPAGGTNLFNAPSTNIIERDGIQTYVVNPLTGAVGQQLRFTIPIP